MSPAQATEALRQAVIDHAMAHQLMDQSEGLLLSEIAVCAHWQRIEADGSSQYTTHFGTTNAPAHVAVGLFRVGQLIESERESDDL